MNPYNIQQVDVPGILSVYESARMNRLREMQANRQMQREDAKASRDAQFQQELSGVFGGQERKPRARAGGVAEVAQGWGQAPAAGMAPRGGVLGAYAGAPNDDPWTGPAFTPNGRGPASTPSFGDNFPGGGAYDPNAGRPTQGGYVDGEPPAMGGYGVPDEAAGAPTQLVDPDELPPRTDGIQINRGALRRMIAIDSERAFEVQTMIYKMNEAQFKVAQRRGEGMAKAALTLEGIQGGTPEETIAMRRAALRELRPQLRGYGWTDEEMADAGIDSIDVSDRGLAANLAFGQELDSIIDDKRQDRALDWRIEDDRYDNQRADRNTDSVIADRGARLGLTRRGQDIASRDRRDSTERSSQDRRYGVDRTDKRIREGYGGGGRKAAGMVGSSKENPVSITSPSAAEKLPSGTWFKANGKIYKRQ